MKVIKDMTIVLYVNEYEHVQIVSKYETMTNTELQKYMNGHPDALNGISIKDKLVLNDMLLNNNEGKFGVYIDNTSRIEGVRESIMRIVYLGKMTYEF